MNHHNWHLAENYAFTESLDAPQWAWEFLRRNTEYQKDWLWFQETWRMLEARYGKPPERDFTRWKKDPDAYRAVDDASGRCRVDQEQLLIECWMGEKWGFYKFPLDPQTDQPLIGEQLLWRETDQPVNPVTDADSPYMQGTAARIALGFDLDAPLRAQLESAKRFLQARQARLRREGSVIMRTTSNLKNDWRLMLRVLDGLRAGESLETVYAVLHTQEDALASEDRLRVLAETAREIVSGGYLELPKIPA